MLYYELDRALERAGGMGVAEAHGVLVGLLLGECPEIDTLWVKEIFPDSEAGDVLEKEARAQLLALYQRSLHTWQSEELEFEPFLPDDRASLQQRTEALAGWCEGLFYGIGLSAAHYSPSVEGAEFLRDVQEFSKVNHAVDEDDEGEDALQVIIEHLRAGIWLLQMEIKKNDKKRI